jgi:hypothetical protein
MTEEEALQEAKSRWGNNAGVKYRTDWQTSGREPFAVGRIKDELFVPIAEGGSWEEAFAKANRRKSKH